MKEIVAAKLQEIYCRESRSFLMYLREASPWASHADQALLVKLRSASVEQSEALEHLAKYFDAHRIPLPPGGGFPMNFTNFNFVAVRSLFPLLRADFEKGIGALEKDRETLPSGPAQQVVDELLAVKRRQMSEFGSY